MTTDRVQLLLAQSCLTPVIRDQVVAEVTKRLEWLSQHSKPSVEGFFKTLPAWLHEVWVMSDRKTEESANFQRSLTPMLALMQQLPVYSLYTAYQPSYVQLQELQQQLMTYFKKPLIIQSVYDPRIIGGFKLETANGFHISQTIDETLTV